MLENFKQYLIEKGYSEFTPSGHPSTVYDYKKRILKICERESISIETLLDRIDFFVERYGPLGKEDEFGRKSYNAYISALRKFKDFKNKE